MILRATGGLLTMLAESGSGTLAGGAHQESFDLLAQSEGREIAEVLNEQYFAPLLETAYPDQPKLAYFDCVVDEVEDTNAVVTQITTLAGAGYLTPAEQVGEKTGYNVEYVAPAMPSPMGGTPITNSQDKQELITNSKTQGQAPIAPENEDELTPSEQEALKALLVPPSAEALASIADAIKSPLAGALSIEPSDDPQTISNAICNAFATGQIDDEQDSDDGDTLENGECQSKTGNCRIHNPKPKAREPKTKTGKTNPFTAPDSANDKVKEKTINRAADRVRKTNKPIHGVISKPGIGKIDIKPGSAGDRKKNRVDAHGLRHVDQKHPEMTRELGRTIVKGQVMPDAKNPSRKQINYGRNKVILEQEINKGSGRLSKKSAKIHTSFKSRSNNESKK